MFKRLKNMMSGEQKPENTFNSDKTIRIRRDQIPIPQMAKPDVRKEEEKSLNLNQDAEKYLSKVRNKINTLAARFAEGTINRKQFQDLYSHYVAEIQMIEQYINTDPDSDAWKQAVAEGQSILIRRKHAARFLGFSIYDHESGIPLRTAGEFGIDSALFVPMLHSYRAAAKEIFGSMVRSTQIEGGNWLCFISGKLTTTIALFSTEPSKSRLDTLEHLQTVFEHANKNLLNNSMINPDQLVCPQEYFLQSTK
ncbi:MAG: hypothetical protein JEZ00_16520 [Anaerolineaceae bacterium]|nr:hypothetical protein [Anaerolineaceae bacterium]